MSTIKTIFLLLFLLSNCPILQAQFDEDDFVSTPIEINNEIVTDIIAIVQDQKGYIWIGTPHGLVRYNGYEYKSYKNNKEDSTSLHHNNIMTLFVDHPGDLWVATTAGLSRYNADCDCFFRYPSTSDKPAPIGFIADMVEDQDKKLWIAMEGGGLYRYEREKDSFTRFLNKPEDSFSIVDDIIRHLLVDRNNNLWIGTGFGNHGEGLIQFNLNTGIVKRFVHNPADVNSLLDNRISALYEDKQGQLLVGTYKCGLHIYDPQKEAFKRIEFDANHPNQLHAPYSTSQITSYSFFTQPYVQFIHQDQKGGYWIGTMGVGINYFDPARNESTFYSHDPSKTNGLLNNYIWSFFEDRQGILWLGNLSGGLYKKDIFRPQFISFGSMTHERGYESPFNPGTVWFGGDDKGLTKLDLKTNKTTNYRHDKNNDKSIGHNSVRISYQEDSTTLWVGLGTIGGDLGGEDGKGGLDRLDLKTGIFTHYKINLKDSGDDFSYTIYSIDEDQEGYMWLAAGPGGLFRSNKDKTAFEPFNFPNPDSASIKSLIYDLQVDSKGAVWLSENEGEGIIYRYDRRQGKFISYIKGFEFTNFAEDENGGIWIGTFAKGLLHSNLADGTYKQYTTDDGLKSNHAIFIVKGEDGIFWINTRNGPCVLDTKTGKITSAGLPVDRYGYGILKSSDGRLFPAGKAISFYPNEIKGNPFSPEIVISDFLISDVSYQSQTSEASEISLSHNQNDISIEYAGLHFSNPSKNRHQYKLTPVDDNWVNAGTQHIARYPNLSPGTYSFEVKAANSDGVWNEEAASISFVISPPWYQTWWAYLLMALFTAGILYSLYRFQLSRKLDQQEANRLKEVDTFKTRFYSNITHEFRTPLTVIRGMADELDQHPDEEPKTKISLIKKNISSLLALVNQMLDLSKLKAGKVNLDLQQNDIIIFIKYLVEAHESFAKLQNVGLQFYSEEKGLLMDFDSKKVEQVLTNLISNAVKFTPEYGKILVVAKKVTENDQAHLQILVKDNGIGISKEQLPFIFDRFHQANPTHENQGTGIGLALVKELMAVMNASISVESEPDKGTTFFLEFPIQNKTLLVLQNDPYEFKTLAHQEDLLNPVSDLSNNEFPILLIIEDNADVTYYLQTCLNDQYQILTSRNGKEGVEKAFEVLPDIIISDVMMPVMDGFEVCAILKEDERSSHIPIILLTAKATSEDKLTGFSSGADAYLIKPFEKEELLIRLYKLMEVRKTLQKKYSSTLLSSLSAAKLETREDTFIEKVEKIILQNLEDEDFSVNELAYALHLSRSQAHRKIKALTGMSAAIYIRHIRFQKAKELLDTSELSIAEIAYQVGFKSPVYFSQIFKETFGESPSATRK